VGLLDLRQFPDGVTAAAELHPPAVALPAHLGHEAGRERVHHGDADPVQTAGDRVAAAAELAARVQDGHDHLDGGPALGRMDVDGDAAPVVDDPQTAVRLQHHVDPVAVAGERLVDRVVDDLVHEVVQSSLPGRSDVHAGAL